MNINDFIFKTLESDIYLEWKKNNVGYTFHNCLYISITNKCNMKCESCCGKFTHVVTNKAEFDIDQCMQFYEVFIQKASSLNTPIVYVTLSGGEITVIDPKLLIDLAYRILKMSAKYGVKVSLLPMSNLYKVSEDHFKFFELVKDINKSQDTNLLAKTSTDIFHFPDGDVTGHIANIKRLNDMGNKVFITFTVDGHPGEIKELQNLMNQYCHLDVMYAFIPLASFNDMDEYYKTHIQFLNNFNNNPEFYRRIFNFKYPAYVTFNYFNTLSLNVVPYLDERLQVSLDSIKTFDDLYDMPLFSWSNFMTKYYESNYPDIFFYSKIIHLYAKLILNN